LKLIAITPHLKTFVTHHNWKSCALEHREIAGVYRQLSNAYLKFSDVNVIFSAMNVSACQRATLVSIPARGSPLGCCYPARGCCWLLVPLRPASTPPTARLQAARVFVSALSTPPTTRRRKSRRLAMRLEERPRGGI
jgi:hypothetical protein